MAAGNQAAESLTDLPLAQLFESSQRLCENLTPATTSDEVETAIRSLIRCSMLIESLGLFSSNEEIDDIPTGDLKYLLVPFYHAELLASTRVTDPSQRQRHRQASLAQLKHFLHRCHQYGVGGLSPAMIEVLDEGGPQDPAVKRTAKMERFRREKVINSQLARFEAQRSSVKKLDEDSQQELQQGGLGSLDEESERQLWLLKIELAILKTLEQYPLIKQEIELLKHAAQQTNGSKPSPEQEAAQRASREEQQKLLGVLRGIAENVTAPSRQTVAANVFRPYVPLPTVTIEQAARQEWQEAMEREQRSKEAEARRRQEEEERGSDDDEQELRKQRAFDDFKDDNPYGWGNSKLRPCA